MEYGEYFVLRIPLLTHQLGMSFFTHVPRRSFSPFVASLPLLYSASSAPALMSRSSSRSCARSRHSTLSFSSGDASPSAVLALHRILQIIQKTLSHRVPSRDRQESFTTKRVACFCSLALGVYARWSQMGAGDLSLLM